MKASMLPGQSSTHLEFRHAGEYEPHEAVIIPEGILLHSQQSQITDMANA